MRFLISTFLWLATAQPLLFAQITGSVFDETGAPLPFVSVYLRGTSIGTSVNTEGNFRLDAPKGQHELVFQYIGYKQHVEKIVVGNTPLRLTVRMQPDELTLAEVEIRDEDPAYRIMRKAIEKRAEYRYKITDYSCDGYVKGFHQLTDAPKKVLGQDVGNMGGILDTNRTGILYLSESVSKVYVQDKKMKEVMVSSKVSGSDNGVSFNRALAADFTFYDEQIDMVRMLLSPLADQAFDYYRFRLEGKYEDPDGMKIYKIAVLPKRPTDPVFGGHLYIVDDWYNLSGTDLFITGATIKQPVLDTLRIRQEFVALSRPDTRVLLNQLVTFRFGVLGFKIKGLFNSVFSNYQIQPVYAKGFFDREVFRVEKDAPKQDSAYWAAIRPVPLTAIESRDYVRKDSLRRIWDSKAYKDSIDRKNNRFRPIELLTGYTWRNSWRHFSVDWPAAYQWIQFNTVQGMVLDIHPTLYKSRDKDDTQFWRAEGTVNYGFTEKQLRGSLSVRRRFESLYYRTAELKGGLLTEQFNSRSPVTTFVNTSSSLLKRLNYMKIYEKAFGKFSVEGRTYPPLWTRISAEYADRHPLVNQSDYGWYKKPGRTYTPNHPAGLAIESPQMPQFERHQALLVQLDAHWHLHTRYSTVAGRRDYITSAWPVIKVQYRKALSGWAGSDVRYDFVQIGLSSEELSTGLSGYSHISVTAGGFFNKGRMELMDYYFPNGNQLLFINPALRHNTFFLLPYYEYGTNRRFVEMHWEHHWEGWLLDRVPLLRRLNWKEVMGAHFYHTNAYWSAAERHEAMPYWEVHFGFENIGWKVFRPLRVDVATGFFGKTPYRTGLVMDWNF